MSANAEKNYGFVKRLLLWAGSAALVITVISAAVLFYVSYQKAYDEQDDLLQEVSGVLARIDVSTQHPGALWMDDDDFEDWFIVDDDSPQSIAKAGSTILVRTLHEGGQTIRAVFNENLHDGAQTLQISGTQYRLYLITLADGKHIAVAQKTKEIEKLARQAALAATLPLLGLSAAIILILAALLWISVKPIRSLTDSINRREPDDLTPIDPKGLPAELLPMVDAFNGVLKRVSELRQSESRFVADAAHELRSPLAALSLQAERLEKSMTTPEAKKQIADLRISIDRAARLVSQLLSLKRAQQDKTESNQNEARISETLASVIEQVWNEAEKKGIDIEAIGFDELDPDSNVTVPVGEDDLFAILRNIMENAVKYCPKGSTVTIELISVQPFKLKVSDNGPGIADKDKERIFDPFYRVLGTGVTGTGLGMAIVKKLAERNNLRLILSDTYSGKAEKGLSVTLEKF